MTATQVGTPDPVVTQVARFGVYYGWLVALATFVTMLATACALGSAGVLMPNLQAEFHWSTAQVSAAVGLRLVLFGLMAPFAAALLRRFGLRAVVLAAMSLIACGLALSLRMRTPLELMLSWGLLVGIGTGMTAMVLGATVATRWFVRRRGVVIGCLTASTATGQLVFVPWLAAVATRDGWRAALGVVLVVLVLAALLAALLLRDHPGAVGLPAYGEQVVLPPPPRDDGLLVLLVGPLQTLRAALRTPVFWLLFGTFYVCGLSTNGLVQTHWVSLCGDMGIVPVGAARVLATIGIFDFLGTLASGWLSDRFDNRRLLFAYYGLRGLSLMYLPHSGFGLGALAVFAVFYGLDWVATVPPTVRLAADAFGRDRAPLVFGWIFTGHQLGAATAAYLAGVIRTFSGSYAPALEVAGVACVLAAVAVLGRLRPRGLA